MNKHYKTIDDIYPLTIVSDRYSGTYSGGKFLAFNERVEDIPEGISHSDNGCAGFWSGYTGIVGKGSTLGEAASDLLNRLNDDAAKSNDTACDTEGERLRTFLDRLLTRA